MGKKSDDKKALGTNGLKLPNSMNIVCHCPFKVRKRDSIYNFLNQPACLPTIFRVCCHSTCGDQNKNPDRMCTVTKYG